ncbi:MAG: GGDEF domain-containing protein, partial [Acholeplasmataceae bacterium]
MDSIEQLFTMSFAFGALMIALVHGFYALQTKRDFFLYWFACWCLLALANLGLLHSLRSNYAFGNYVYTYAVALASYFFVRGSYAYVARPLHRNIHLFLALFIVVILGMTLFSRTLILVPLALFLLSASFYSVAALSFFRDESKQKKLYGLAIILLVIHQFIYLYTYETAAYDAIGYVILGMTGTLIGFGPIALYHSATYREQSEIQDHLYFLSYHDSLTNLKNRAHLEEVLDEYEARRTVPFSIFMIDLNNLKEINDTLGHQVGDELLVETASVLRRIFDSFEHIIRLGGDEFLILLPDVDRASAESYRKALKETIVRLQPLNM